MHVSTPGQQGRWEGAWRQRAVEVELGGEPLRRAARRQRVAAAADLLHVWQRVDVRRAARARVRVQDVEAAAALDEDEVEQPIVHPRTRREAHLSNGDTWTSASKDCRGRWRGGPRACGAHLLAHVHVHLRLREGEVFQLPGDHLAVLSLDLQRRTVTSLPRRDQNQARQLVLSAAWSRKEASRTLPTVARGGRWGAAL